MPDLSKYDLDFRPKNYWDLRDVLTFVEAKITGKERNAADIPIRISIFPYINNGFPVLSIVLPHK